MKTLLTVLFFLVAIFGAGYIAIWWGIITPIWEIVTSRGDIWIIAFAVGKFFIRDFCAVIWFFVFLALAKSISSK